MARLDALGLARNVIALVVVAIVAAVVVLSLGPLAAAPGDSSAASTPPVAAASPTPVQSASSHPPTPTSVAVPSATATLTPADSTATQTVRVTTAPIVYTNSNGPDPGDYAPDAYPFLEEARALPDFAGVWVDENLDYHVAVSKDIEAAIAALEPGIPRGVTVYFHLYQYSYAFLDDLRDEFFEDRDELMTKGIVISFGSVREIEGQVYIGMSPLSGEAVRYMESRYTGPIVYEYGGVSALRPFEPPRYEEVRLIALEDGDDLGFLTCGHRPFPEGALESAPVAPDATGPEYDALREDLGIYVDVYGDLSSLGWVLAEKDEFGATFLTRSRDGWFEAPVFAGSTGWVPGTIDDCSPKPFTLDDHPSASWSLDPDFPASRSGSTEIHVLVTEHACASGGSPVGRILPPIVEYRGSTLNIDIWIRGVGPATCPGNPSLAVTILLPKPLGDRELAGDTPRRH